MLCAKPKGRCGITIFIRSFHTALCLALPLTLLTRDSALKHAFYHIEDLAYGIGYVSLLCMSLLMYFLACFIDPGYLQIPKRKKVALGTDSEEDSLEDSRMMASHQDTKDNRYRQCDFCEVQQPMRAKHCEDCERCVRKFDHHCPWLETCVGERNHKFFWLFLVSTAALIIWTFLIAWNAIIFRRGWVGWLKENAVVIVDLVILVVGGFVVCGLVAFHTYLMLKGLSTWEAVSRERITYLKYLDEDYNPFDEGVVKNIFSFLCDCRLHKWESLYAKKADVASRAV